MAVDVPYIEPKSVALGEKLHWRKTYADYPSTLYTLQYRFRGPTGTGIDQAATAYNSDYDIAVTAIATAKLAVETYRWQAWLTEDADATNTFLIEEGSIRVDVGFASGGTKAIDLGTTAETILAALEATMAGKATKDQLQYRIASGNGEREIRRMSYTELIAAIKYYTEKVAGEKNAARRKAGDPFFKNYLIHSNEA